MIDAGSKTLAADRLESGARQHFGYVLDHPEFTLDGLSEEHGHLSIPGNSSIRVGNRLRIIPNHICPCINLHDSVYLVSGDQVVERWKVAARGMVI
jgi:D-serine deaminase-like pyridoxal phosphate-dependent protein